VAYYVVRRPPELNNIDRIEKEAEKEF